MKEIIISKRDENQRVDKYVRKYLNDAPLSFIYKLFRKKDVKINGHWVKQDYIVKENEKLTIYVTDEQLKEFVSTKEVKMKDFPHEIVYEDENILIVNKPRSLLVHGDENEKKNTLANDVLNYLYFKGEYNPNEKEGFTPAPAHRLDRNTSGIVVFAKKLSDLQELELLFKEKENLEKHYYALVVGNLKKEERISAPLKKDPKTKTVRVTSLKDGGVESISIVKPVKNYKEYTLVDITLITGRTHQIRVHMSYINHPVVGDSKYGNFLVNKKFKEEYKFENQFLHAYLLKFGNVGGELSYLKNRKFIAEMPLLEKNILDELI